MVGLELTEKWRRLPQLSFFSQFEPDFVKNISASVRVALSSMKAYIPFLISNCRIKCHE